MVLDEGGVLTAEKISSRNREENGLVIHQVVVERVMRESKARAWAET